MKAGTREQAAMKTLQSSEKTQSEEPLLDIVYKYTRICKLFHSLQIRCHSFRREGPMPQRVNLDMATEEAVCAIAGSNMGALSVCSSMVDRVEHIDPSALFGGMSYLMMLDNLGLYEEDVFILFKYVCGQDMPKMLAVLNATEHESLTGVTRDQVTEAIQKEGEGVDLDPDAVLARMQEIIPGFGSGTLV